MYIIFFFPVKVVKHSTDSVIYRHHSQRYSETMAAREERHRARLNSMPIMRQKSVPSCDAAGAVEIQAAAPAKSKSCSLGDIHDFKQNLARRNIYHARRSLFKPVVVVDEGSAEECPELSPLVMAESDPLLNIIKE